jgi:FecR protein
MSVVKVSSLAFAAWMVSAGAFASDGEWTVRKTSGEVWTGASGIQPVSLSQETVLKPGDTVTTGRNGRVLLVRGQESILIAPNSIVGVPAEKKGGAATTITQRAGSILLEVEKRNVPHFEVETPYLAAVVKGTQFRVSVTATGTRVDVQRGQVEVVDFKSGQIAQVLPGQAAQSFAHGAHGLSLTGAGAFKPIERGAPRASTLEQIKVPKSGIRMPQMLERGRPSTRSAGGTHHQDARATRGAHGAVRISAPLGEVRLNVQKVTHGLARSTSAAGDTGRRAPGKETTIWNTPDGKSGTAGAASAINASNGNGNSNGNSGGNGGGNGNGASSAASASSGSAATAAVAAGSSGNGNGNGNGNGKGNNGNGNGGGNGSGNGNGGNGNGGNGNGGNGNGNGNGAGNGNGNGKGKGKS